MKFLVFVVSSFLAISAAPEAFADCVSASTEKVSQRTTSQNPPRDTVVISFKASNSCPDSAKVILYYACDGSDGEKHRLLFLKPGGSGAAEINVNASVGGTCRWHTDIEKQNDRRLSKPPSTGRAPPPASKAKSPPPTPRPPSGDARGGESFQCFMRCSDTFTARAKACNARAGRSKAVYDACMGPAKADYRSCYQPCGQ